MSNRRSRPRWRAVVAGTFALALASLVPSPLERRSEWDRVGPDKLLHLVGHAGYAVLLADALNATRYGDRTAAVLAVCLSTAQSLVTGRLQAYVPGREFEVEDVLAGLLGAIPAALGWYVLDEPSNATDAPEPATATPE